MCVFCDKVNFDWNSSPYTCTISYCAEVTGCFTRSLYDYIVTRKKSYEFGVEKK